MHDIAHLNSSEERTVLYIYIVKKLEYTNFIYIANGKTFIKFYITLKIW